MDTFNVSKDRFRWHECLRTGFLVLLFSACVSCSALPFVKQNKASTRIFLTDFSTAWTATFEAVAAGKDIIRSQNRDTGIIETNWIDNTDSRNFLDVFSDEEFFLRSRFRIQVQVQAGPKSGENAAMIRIIKYQQKETTFLGGWQEAESDGLEEAVYLYRIGRLISISQFNEEAEAHKNQIHDPDADI